MMLRKLILRSSGFIIQTVNSAQGNGKILPKQWNKMMTCYLCRTINSSTVQFSNQGHKRKFQEYYTAVLAEVQSNKRLQMLSNNQEMSKDPVLKERAMKKWIFLEAVEVYLAKNEEHRRGHVEFITDALAQMEELGVHRDLSCYKALLKVLPKKVMVLETVWQYAMHHYPRQQDIVVELMEQMETNGLMADWDFGDQLIELFGEHGHVYRKFRRSIYWMRKFHHRNPFQLPHELPVDPVELAILALKKMAIDYENEIKVWKVSETDDLKENLFIASAQSPSQRELINLHPVDQLMYVEGGFRVWMREAHQTYFILRADSDPKLFRQPTEEEELDNLFEFETIFDTEKPKALVPRPNIHQQEDGTILAMCITQTGCKDSLISWIRCLQERNPKLAKIQIVFRLATSEDLFLVPTSSETQPVVNISNEENKKS
ncbi:evolutionarily conserved signaling intermediate in Toll pathway, mitochondrial-like [Mya arenaria]|uniref:evolutionarily conserved signaling intermediate in Toll pathway, mitochondrial-like n=1 Tax=Mya arenaria TaxID=6604 RepID=UPI0022DEDD45|nr:evolutionarily conserved signaling intermediate in Toll pathway, mitochondrial-like [Mya arenaria]